MKNLCEKIIQKCKWHENGILHHVDGVSTPSQVCGFGWGTANGFIGLYLGGISLHVPPSLPTTVDHLSFEKEKTGWYKLGMVM